MRCAVCYNGGTPETDIFCVGAVFNYHSQHTICKTVILHGADTAQHYRSTKAETWFTARQLRVLHSSMDGQPTSRLDAHAK